ncbi:MAG: hypothetical protein JSU58_09190 [Dehalococcoidales bacterium]|nr:MAG: hypothetical protein JSU58_09190 [Dehalococcoidales bacterium]
MATQDRVYKCLNPVGIQDPVDLYPLAPRLDRFDGKTIMFNMMVNVEQSFLTPLEKMLRDNYPGVNWIFRESGSPIPNEQFEAADALIQGVAF